jgi:hypothetical protein
MESKPRFVIKSTSVAEQTVTKAKYVALSNREKLQVFVELACYTTLEDQEIIYIDASHTANVRKAGRWFKEELNFLSKRDAAELRDFWNLAVEDGSNTGTLFDLVKALQEKYP